MAQCPPGEYFDSLLLSCKPCHLRCAGTPPRPCEQHCHKSTDSGGVLWICLGIGIILVLALLLLMVLFKRKHLKQLKLKHTEPPLERRGALAYSVEECTCSECGPRAPARAAAACPLPATDEGAAALVTTKSADYCSYVLGAG
ncbi:tumor necrosis factor receptor superfamily member 17 [Eudromia elegans]